MDFVHSIDFTSLLKTTKKENNSRIYKPKIKPKFMNILVSCVLYVNLLWGLLYRKNHLFSKDETNFYIKPLLYKSLFSSIRLRRKIGSTYSIIFDKYFFWRFNKNNQTYWIIHDNIICYTYYVYNIHNHNLYI